MVSPGDSTLSIFVELAADVEVGIERLLPKFVWQHAV